MTLCVYFFQQLDVEGLEAPLGLDQLPVEAEAGLLV